MSRTVPQHVRDKISTTLKNRVFSIEHRKNISISLSKRIITDEHRKHMSESHLGKTSPRKGVKLSEHTKQLLSKSHKIPEDKKKRIDKICIGCGVSFKITPSKEAYGWGKFHSKACQRNYERGENSPQWKGGIAPLRKVIQGRPEYIKWRSDVFERDNYCDWFSGCRGDVEAHHLIPFSTLLKIYNVKTLEDALKCEALWDTNNGITLLKTSHRAFHEIYYP